MIEKSKGRWTCKKDVYDRDQIEIEDITREKAYVPWKDLYPGFIAPKHLFLTLLLD